MQFWDKTKGKASVIDLCTVYPLPIIKQVVTMFMSLNPSGFQANHQSLVRFVLDRERRYLDPMYRFWVYFVAPGPLRATPPCAILNIESGHHTLGLEFSFPPFGYMMTIGSRPENSRLFEISHFARFPVGAMEWVQLNLATLPTHTPVLGDYRTFKQLERKAGDTNTVLNMF